MVRGEGRDFLNSSFRKLAIPPRINDRLLDPLSVEDHAKYLRIHNRLRSILDLMKRKGATRPGIVRFGQSADWLRAVDHLMRRWSPEWAFAYIHQTFPPFEWPDDPERGTVDPLTFAFLWLHKAADPETLGALSFRPLSPFPCPLCSKEIGWKEIVLRRGLPTCGCAKRILRPTHASIIVGEFPRLALIENFRRRCREQRVLDVTADPPGGLVFLFSERRAGASEVQVSEAIRNGSPVFVIGKCDAARQLAKRQPVFDGLVLH